MDGYRPLSIPEGTDVETIRLAKGAGFLLFVGVSFSHGVTLFVERDLFRLREVPSALLC